MFVLLVALLSSAASVFAWYCEDPGWTEYKGNCYFFELYGEAFGIPCSAESCASHCAGLNASMLCIEDQDREQFIRDHAQANFVWLDYSDASSEGNYVWGPTCANTGYTNWNSPTEPNQGTGVNCATFSTYADTWLGTLCEDTFQMYQYCNCEKPAIVSTPVCPDGWTVNGDECMLMDQQWEATTWEECQDLCGIYGGRMLCVNSPDKENYILARMENYTLPSVWLSYNDISSEGDWRWSPNCDYTSYTNWDPVHAEPNGATVENCAELYGDGHGWNDAQCDLLSAQYPRYCFCEGSGGDPTLLAYPGTDTGGGDNGNDSNSSSSALGGIIAGVVIGCLLLTAMACFFVRQRAILSSPVFTAQQNQPYATVNNGGALAPSPYGGGVPTSGTYSYSSTPYGTPYTYPNATNGAGAVPGQYASVPSGGYTGTGYAPGTYAGGGGTVGMVPLAPSAPSAPPAGPAYAPHNGYAPVYQQQNVGAKTSSAPASVATATAVPYSGVSASDNYGDGEVVMAEAVVTSADV